MIASSYQAVSGAGAGAPGLMEQVEAISRGEKPELRYSNTKSPITLFPRSADLAKTAIAAKR